MLLKAISNRYASAIYKMAKDGSNVEKQLGELRQVGEALTESTQLTGVLQSPTVADQIKKKILKEIFDKKVSPVTLHFLYVLVDKKREEYFHSIVESYEEFMREESGVVQCHVRSAKPLLKKTQTALIKNLETHLDKKVELELEVDSSMLGGMIITMQDRVIDASLDTQLAQIQGRLASVGWN